ncbi:LIM domain-containing protein-like protein [Dinothrombium tinctorium]|uniref:LIM domain-containing protein-like protein n=1 Tax=Dinothrombium tinctorium TaxID=1965070 RepID=A0A3S4QZN8_9ACAR|nr:LIM domain-containing protein-like protein [Dinothrombium tinctorium]RWS09765.1 LIM domain-containing protein-like protein [Dinothrombium tinctorium]
MSKDWHTTHFCCWQCDETLTGRRYILKEEHPYCIKCYESMFSNVCEECSKAIGIDAKDLSYKDKHWHEECFVCTKCKMSLVDQPFGSKAERVYCGSCYDTAFASRCDGCSQPFKAGMKKMEYKGHQWHENCFCCKTCSNPIGNKSFVPRDTDIFCSDCYESNFSTRCVKCNETIGTGGITYKDEPWHMECFVCVKCSNSLAGQKFTTREGSPFCSTCYNELYAKRCCNCEQAITGAGGTRFVSFEDKNWHNECFVCSGCRCSLVGKGFIGDGNDILCPECAKKKISM